MGIKWETNEWGDQHVANIQALKLEIIKEPADGKFWIWFDFAGPGDYSSLRATKRGAERFLRRLRDEITELLGEGEV